MAAIDAASTKVGGGRAQATRTALLAAAEKVFTTAGYADANVTDIVSLANSSVGSLYHHFGGKSDLYVALFDDYQARQQHRASVAFRTALANGENEALPLFITGARAYLEGCWEDRQLAQLFLSGGGPPGFDVLERAKFRSWLSKNSMQLNDRVHPLSELHVLILTGVATVVGREVAVAPSKAKARKMIDEALALMGRLYP
jgi:AcrR family transcriptional regulator